MITIRLLGSLRVCDAGGRELDALLRQPKRIALLSYLAVARPRGFHRRDTLTGLFWPESNQDNARHALRQALHVLRQELGEEAILTRGEGDVGVNREILSIDVVSFEQTFERRDYRSALEQYRGEFLQGYFISQAIEFQRWVDQESTRLRELAAGAGWALAHEHIAAGRLVEAERTAQQALMLIPTDEGEVRRFIETLAEAGDRAAAARFYEIFSRRIKEDYEIEPSPETVACVEGVRTGSGPERPIATPVRAESPDAAPRLGSGAKPARWRRLRASLLAVPIVVAVLAMLILSGGGPPLYADRVAVAPFENRSGDPTYDEMGQWASDWISSGLKNEGVLEVVPAGVSTRVSEDVRESSNPYLDLARATRSGTVVIGWYYVQGDSVRFHAEVLDAQEGDLLYSLDPVSGLIASALEPIEAMRSKVLGVLVRHVDPDWPGNPTLAPPPPSVEVYRETMAGLHSHVRQEYVEAIEHYQRALALDSFYFEALKGLASSLHNLRRFSARDSVGRILDQNRHRFTAFQQARVDRQLGWIRGDLELEYRGAQEMARLDPLGERFDVAYTALRANHPQQAIEILTRREMSSDLARQWLGTWIVHTEALHLLGDHDQELRVARQAREAHPDQDWSYLAEVRALIGLGRIDRVRQALDSLAILGLQNSTYRTARSLWRVAAAELRAHGYGEMANEYFSRSIEYYRGRVAEDSTVDWRPPLANSLYRGGEYAEAYEIFAQLHHELPDSIRPWSNMGVTAARLGRRGEAQLISDSIAKWNLKYIQGRKAYFRARISAILGDRTRAVELLRDAISNGLGSGMYLHTSDLAIILRDYPAYQELVRPKW